MARYTDGFLLPVPKKKVDVYLRIARRAGKIWREHGALEYRECVAEDMNAMGLRPFPHAANTKRGETVVLSWIIYKSRAHRDRVNAKVMADPRIKRMMDEAPFDYTRMAYGGFTVAVDV
jgi:uncharacterized protein YbaA (DUF1428 family)